MQNAIHALISVTGVMWLYALAAVFVGLVSELAHAPREPGAEPPLTPLRVLTLTAAYLAPLLLLAHAIIASSNAGQGAFLPVTTALIDVGLATIVGALLAKAPAIARPVHATAPLLTVAACAFTIWVTWRPLWTLIAPLLPR